jgi:hypothetical protein
MAGVGDAPYAGGTVLECGYRARAAAEPGELWHALARIGGETGWYYGDALWRLRGLLDKLLGGVGLRRVGINPDTLRVGDPLDFWRCSRWRKPPAGPPGRNETAGRALLEFRLLRVADDTTELTPIPGSCPGAWPALLLYATIHSTNWSSPACSKAWPTRPANPSSAAGTLHPGPPGPDAAG